MIKIREEIGKVIADLDAIKGRRPLYEDEAAQYKALSWVKGMFEEATTLNQEVGKEPAEADCPPEHPVPAAAAEGPAPAAVPEVAKGGGVAGMFDALKKVGGRK